MRSEGLRPFVVTWLPVRLRKPPLTSCEKVDPLIESESSKNVDTAGEVGRVEEDPMVLWFDALRLRW